MGDLLNRIKGNIIERRDRLKEGKINSIPSPFERLEFILHLRSPKVNFL